VASSGSARPALSSARGRSAASTTYTAAMTALTIMTIEAKDSTKEAPPASARASSIMWTSFSMSSTSPRIAPYIVPSRKTPAPKPASVPRCSRSAKPKGRTSAADAVRLPGRGGRSPSPTSRRELST
jgi:hypothetical protein